jgi:uncharacterized protein (UPF0548 family)
MAGEHLTVKRARFLRDAGFTYPEVEMTRQAALPAGYRTLRRRVALPGSVTFEAARGAALGWQIQRRAGVRVTASSPIVVVGAVVDLRIGVGLLSVVAPCRVVFVVDEADRCGFAYGTLPGHPESGEESFMIERRPDGSLTLEITAFSRPATTLSKTSGPLGRRIQDLFTSRYLRALDRC